MRIHTNHPLPDSIFTNARQAAGVQHEKYSHHGSRTHATAREVILTGDSNRATNQRHAWPHDEYTPRAASWDQWGIYLAFIFEQDPTARMTYYRSAEHFHEVTGNRFNVAEGGLRSTTDVGYQKTSHKWQYDYERSAPLSGPVVLHCVNGKHWTTQADGVTKRECAAVQVRA